MGNRYSCDFFQFFFLWREFLIFQTTKYLSSCGSCRIRIWMQIQSFILSFSKKNNFKLSSKSKSLIIFSSFIIFPSKTKIISSFLSKFKSIWFIDSLIWFNQIFSVFTWKSSINFNIQNSLKPWRIWIYFIIEKFLLIVQFLAIANDFNIMYDSNSGFNYFFCFSDGFLKTKIGNSRLLTFKASLIRVITSSLFPSKRLMVSECQIFF